MLPEESVGDVPRDHLEQLKSGFYQTKVIVTSEQADHIEKCTIDQADNQLWIVVGGIASNY